MGFRKISIWKFTKESNTVLCFSFYTAYAYMLACICDIVLSWWASACTIRQHHQPMLFKALIGAEGSVAMRKSVLSLLLLFLFDTINNSYKLIQRRIRFSQMNANVVSIQIVYSELVYTVQSRARTRSIHIG